MRSLYGCEVGWRIRFSALVPFLYLTISDTNCGSVKAPSSLNPLRIFAGQDNRQTGLAWTPGTSRVIQKVA